MSRSKEPRALQGREDVSASGVSPEFAACRELEARGIAGKANFWREGKTTWDFRMDVHWGANHCVSETDRQRIKFGKYAEHPMAKKAA